MGIVQLSAAAAESGENIGIHTPRKRTTTPMDDDERCCGSGHCMINAEGLCWCGQQWDGTKMCRPAAKAVVAQDDRPTEAGSDQSADA